MVWSSRPVAAGTFPSPKSSARSEDLVYRSVAKRHQKQIAVWSGLDVGHDSKVPAHEQAFALGDIKFCEVVCNAVLKTRVVDSDFPAVAGQVEMKQVTPNQIGSGRADEKIPFVLWSQRPAFDETDACRCDLVLPAQLRLGIVRARQHEQAIQSLLWCVGN